LSHRSEKAEQKVRLKQKKYELKQLYREKRSEELEALEEVFDKSTLMVIYRMINTGIIREIFGVVRSGKESKLFWGRGKDGQDVAIKIYLTWTAEFRKGRLMYVEGDPRFQRSPRDLRSLTHLWARKEFRNLEECTRGGVRVPKPFFVKSNVLAMEFIGAQGEPAPLLREHVLSDPGGFYEKIVTEVQRMCQKANLVHGDLSEYNVMVYENSPVIIDVSQAVSLDHPMAEVMLKRDISNVNRYFRSLGVDVTEEPDLYLRVIGEHGNKS
jgi:RIO kinase 1